LRKELNFDIPQQLYGDQIKNQTVSMQLNSYLPATAKQVCILLYMSMGDAPGGAFWIKL
jgi:hypothetical protein